VFELVPVKAEIDIAGFHSLYYFEFTKDFYHPPEKHDFWELVYVDDGRINAIVDGIGCMLSKGQMIFHQPMELHSHIANHQDTSNVAVVSFSCSSPLMSCFNKKIFTLEKPAQKVFALFMAEAKNALGTLPGDFQNKSPLDFSHAAPGSVQLMQCYLVELLFSLIRAGDVSVRHMDQTETAKRLAEDSLVDTIERYIVQNVAEQPSLQILCQHFSVSRTYLCRIFKESTGSSAVDYWIRLKIHEAKKMIRQGDNNFSQIAEKLGYSGIHHFSRMFKRVTGISPSAYKTSVGL